MIQTIQSLKHLRARIFACICAIILLTSIKGFGQAAKPITRIAKLTIDSTQLNAFLNFLKEEIETSIRVEQGVLTLYAVAEKNNANKIIIFETYANQESYLSHLQTMHFKKYKTGTDNMIKLLELVEVDPVLLGAKRNYKN